MVDLGGNSTILIEGKLAIGRGEQFYLSIFSTVSDILTASSLEILPFIKNSNLKFFNQFKQKFENY